MVMSARIWLDVSDTETVMVGVAVPVAVPVAVMTTATSRDAFRI